MKMDNNPGTEEFVVIASVQPINDLQFSGTSASSTEFENALLNVVHHSSGKTTINGEWRKVEGSDVLVANLTVRHE
jgi:hypothetical protein